jgi:CheY-like chemotaxis protein
MNRISTDGGYLFEEPEYVTDLAPIFIAEDDLDDLELIRQALKKAGFINPIRVAEDGMQALDFLREVSSNGSDGIPLLMFLDLNLPRLSGLELLTWLRRQDELMHMPIVILSHSEHQPDIDEAFRMGANAYWVKPALSSDLVHLLAGLKRKIGNAERDIAEQSLDPK